MSFTRPTKEEAKNRIEELVKKFNKNKKQYLDKAYDETNVRVEFIDKFFEALGWDVYNEKGATNDKKEVLREEDLKMNDATKHPDYAFNDRGQVLFYVEAKKPSVDIKDDKAPAYQLRRYGWNKKLAISILTDFEEFAIYDVSRQPKSNDKSTTGRIKFITYDKYIENFDFLYDTFSWVAVYDKGTFDDYVATFKIKGTEEIDNKLLDTITDWRQNLAKRISLDNNLNAKELNIAVQKIIDRILFLRIAEDKQIEQYGSLLSIINNENIYNLLVEKFDDADNKYNSGLFKKEKWLDDLNVDDKVLYDLIISMYPEGDCPYEWQILPIEILGNIYEKFLGSEIILKNVAGGKTTAIIDEKPEVKKAGGVYYTPKYIVDYIVKETVSKKLDSIVEAIVGTRDIVGADIIRPIVGASSTSPKNIDKIIKAADKLKILDMACGSGSFLIGTYKYLLDWYFNLYSSDEKKYLKKGILVKTNNGIQLSIEEKKRILVNNIYGVDIDYQAVEVTKLSLFLQMLDKQGRLVDEAGSENILMQTDRAILPDLSNNIKCGNSLVGTDIYTVGAKLTHSNVNAFDFEIEFADIMKNDGFDIVIGNPPYFNVQSLGANNEQIKYIQNKYSDIWRDKSDILFYFINKAMELSKDNIGFIVSNAFLYSDKANLLRNKILNDNRLNKIVNFEEFLIFGAGITTCVILFSKDKKKIEVKSLKGKNYSINDVNKFINDDNNFHEIKLKLDEPFSLANELTSNINDSIDKNTIILGDILFVGKGMETAANDVFCFDEYPKKFPAKYIKKRIEGENICPYYLKANDSYILYYENVEDFKDLPKVLQDYLNENKSILKERATVKNEGRPWWRYSRPMHKEYYDKKKIWCSYRSKDNRFYLDETSDCIGLTNTTVIFDTNEEYDIRYILGIVNSKLMNYRFKTLAKQTGSGVFEYFPNSVGRMPIAKASPDEQKSIVELVDKMIMLTKDGAFDERAYKKLLSDINDEVYKVYGLSDKEIAEIEK